VLTAKDNCPELQNQHTELPQRQNGSLGESRVRNVGGILASHLEQWKENRSRREERPA